MWCPHSFEIPLYLGRTLNSVLIKETSYVILDGFHCIILIMLNALQVLFISCRRRLPVIMVKLRMAQHIGDAAKFVEQGRILTT